MSIETTQIPTAARAAMNGHLKEQLNRVTTGHAPSVRGNERWMISLLTFILLLALVMVSVHIITSHRERLALINKPAVVTRRAFGQDDRDDS